MCVMSERAGPRPSERELCETQDCPFYQASRFGQVYMLIDYNVEVTESVIIVCRPISVVFVCI